MDRLVDTDMHLTEGVEEVFPYVEEPYGSVLERGEGDYPSPYPDPGYFNPSMIGKIQPPIVVTRESVREAMAELDLDRVIINPTTNLYLPCMQHDEFAAAVASAYNEWVLDDIVAPDEGIYASALVAPHRPTLAAAEIDDRRDEPGVASVMVPSAGCHPPLGNRQYDPIYDAASSAGLPVLMHNVSGGLMASFPFQFKGFNRTLTSHITSHPVQHMTHLADMIVQGVPERFPDLEVVMQEAGLGWVPFMMRRMDKDYSNMREDAPMLDRMPSEYVRDQFYFTTQPLEGDDDPEYVEQVLRLTGVDNVMLSTDYPHFDFDHALEMVFKQLRRLDDDEITAICGGNSMEVFAF